MIAAVPLILFPFCLIAAALSDARRYIIPNNLSITLIVGFAMAAMVTGMAWDDVSNHVSTALVTLAMGFGLFCIAGGRVFAAGDAKLMTAVSLWFGWPAFLTTVLVISILGGLMSVVIGLAWLLSRWYPRMSLWVPPLARFAAMKKPKCPYGIAISLGALLTFTDSPLFEALYAQIR